MISPTAKAPFLKSRGFNPMPVVRGGIPKFADSRLNPKVIGTPEWEAYWNEQLYYCINGFTTGSIKIPGRYYYYLNFNSMATVNGIIAPDMVDLHLELALIIDYVSENGLNFICAKKRRAGISEFFQKAKVDYDFRFVNGSHHCGIAAGQEGYVQDFIRKWQTSEASLPPELRIKKLKQNQNEIIAGYKYRTESGDLVDDGTMNTIHLATMFKNPALFKGKFLKTAIGEECGEFEHLQKFVSHTIPCLKDGSIQVGSMYLYGTGGNMNKGSADFEQLWQDSVKGKNNFIHFLITAERFHKPFYGGCALETPVIPNLLQTHKPFELIGVEDTKAAMDTLVKERTDILKSGNTEKYQEHLKDYPFNEQDVFRKTIINVFDTDLLQNQSHAISELSTPKYMRCKLEPKKDKEGRIIEPMELELIIVGNSVPEEECILIHKDYLYPDKKVVNHFCAGGDSYDQDKAKTSKSKGAMCVIARRSAFDNSVQMGPVAVVFCRPRRKEIFYEMCLRTAIWFDLRQSLLIDLANKLIFSYFKERGYAHILAYRPKKFERDDSQQTEEFGFHINNHSKQLMVGLMQSITNDYTDQIWFPELINQLQNYDEVEIGSDNDLADAFGIALVQDVSEDVQARNSSDYDDKNTYQIREWKTDSNGNKVPVEENNELKKMFGEEKDVPGRFLSF